MKRFFCFLIFTFLFILYLLTPFSSLVFTLAYAQSGWGPDVRLTYFWGYYYHPRAVCNGDTVHLVWWEHYGVSGQLREEVFYKRSTDAGETWGEDVRLSVEDGQSSVFPEIAVSGNTVRIIWIEDSYGILYHRSTNAGTTWKAIDSIVPGMVYSSIQAIGDIVYVAGTIGALGVLRFTKSYDEGNKWQPIVEVTKADAWPRFHIIGSDALALVISYDNGPDPDIWYLDGTERGLYDKLATSTVVYRNTNFPFNSWDFLTSGFRTIHPAAFSSSLPAGIFAKAVRSVVNPQGGTSYAGISVYRSTDSGNSWSIIHSVYSYESHIRGPKTLVNHPLHGEQIYLAFEEGMDFHSIHSTTDCGLSLFEWDYSSACLRQSIAVDESTFIAYEVDDTQYPENQRDSQVLVTYNGGETWNIGGNMPGSPLSMVSFPNNSGVVYVGTGDDDSGRKLAAGIYFMQLKANEFNKIEKVILLR